MESPKDTMNPSLTKDKREPSAEKTEECLADDKRDPTTNNTEESLTDDQTYTSTDKTELSLRDKKYLSTGQTKEPLADDEREPHRDKTEEPLADDEWETSIAKTVLYLADDNRESTTDETDESLTDYKKESSTDKTEEPLTDEEKGTSTDKPEEFLKGDKKEPHTDKTKEYLVDNKREPTSYKTDVSFSDDNRKPATDKTEESLADDSREPKTNETEVCLADDKKGPSTAKTEKSFADEKRESYTDNTEEFLSDKSDPTSDNAEESLPDDKREPLSKTKPPIGHNVDYKGGCINPENNSQPWETQESEICRFSRYKYGYNHKLDGSIKEYTVLLLGGSRCGKSTLIDFIANFFMGIESPKNKRDLLYVTQNIKDKESFTFYTFCTKENVFNFIDSPSISNRSGFVNKKKREIFQKFIYKIKQNNIEIHAIWFVIQSHFARLGPAEENTMLFVKDFLGGSIGHLIPFITFADADTPPVLEVLQTFDIDISKHLAFNNVCLNKTTNEVTELSEIYWINGLENMQKGIHSIMNLEPIDLILGMKVLIGNATEMDTDILNFGGAHISLKSFDHKGGCINPEKKLQSQEPQESNIYGFIRYKYGYDHKLDGSIKEYTILLIGAPKCGKSTLIDFIYNFFMGIDSPKDKNCLFYVKTNENELFAFYTFCTKDTIFTFIDSPGIRNSFKVDKEIKSFIKYIKNVKMNAIVLVINKNYQNEEHSSVLDFTEKVLNRVKQANIIPLTTFDDDIDPQYKFRMNNICLNETTEKITEQYEIYWEKGLKTIQKLLNYIICNTMQTNGTTETKKVNELKDQNENWQEILDTSGRRFDNEDRDDNWERWLMNKGAWIYAHFKL